LYRGFTIAQRASVTAPHSAPKPLFAKPAPAWSANDRRRVQDDLRAEFASALAGADRYSLCVIDGRGSVLFDDRATSAVTPASVQKLVVADTSLNTLGPRYRFHTILAAQRSVGGDGVLGSNLWIVGSGDPSLRSSDTAGGVGTLAQNGLRKVGGGVVVDPTAMRGPEINPHWSADDADEDYDAPTSAVSLDGDTVEFRVYGTSYGAPARIATVPESDAVRYSGHVTTGGDNVIVGGTNTPNEFQFGGTIPPASEEKYWLPVHNIPRYVGSVLERQLRDHGITTTERASVGNAPLDAIVLWDHRSQTLPVLVQHMLFVSDNHYAEQLLRAVGADASDAPDDAGGLAAEREFLRARGIPIPGLHIVDGSGLARANRIAAVTLARILSDSELRDGGAELYPLLPEGGRQGTLKNYDFTTALGRVRAKTGHIGGVVSLAGYVTTRHHGRLAFAFMVNGSPGDPDDAIVRAVDRLATF
jgi:D-alanyl-D-alanine carboxypeptidase/D-alanyl-D-alanine-endopeptidase (penicillin-binding protein 4)